MAPTEEPVKALSLVSPFMRSPALPWEVIEMAINHCSDDTATLRAFALTCSQLHPRSTIVLFKHVDIQSQNQLSRFYHAVQARPHLQLVVRSLSFPRNGHSPFPLQLLSILPRLHHVTFTGRSLISVRNAELNQSTPISGMQFATSLGSLMIRNATFHSQVDFLDFLVNFPNMENLTCEYLSLQTHNPFVATDVRRRLQLRTLNILRNVHIHVTETLLHVAHRATTSTLAIDQRTQSSHMLRPQSREDLPTALIWWIQAKSEQLQDAIRMSRNLEQTAMKDVTLVLWDHDIGCLYKECHDPAHLEACAALKEVLLGYPAHSVLLSASGGPILNVRKTISWSDEFSKLSFHPLSDKWALPDDVKSGKPGHDSDVTALVISSDGRWVATASKDFTIILWDARDACILQEWFARSGEVRDLAFSPDGQRLASTGEDGMVAIWDISRSPHQVATLQGHPTSFKGCAWSSDGAYIASQEDDRTMRLWDGRTYQPLPRDRAKTTRLRPLFSPDSRWLLVHGWDSCGILEVASDTYLAFEFPQGGELCEDGFPTTARFSPQSTHVAASYTSGTVRVWDVATRAEPLLLRGHEDWVRDVVFSPDGRLLLLASVDRTMTIWNAHTGAMVRSLKGHTGAVFTACFSPCGKYIASASEDKTVRLWETRTGSCMKQLSDHGSWVQHVAFTSDGTMLWSAAYNGTALGRRLQDIIPDIFKS